MHLLPARRKRSADDNMIPLINIVFLLLIFFMVAGQIQRRPQENIQLPDPVAMADEISLAEFIEMNRDGELFFRGHSTTLEHLPQQLAGVGQLTLIADRDSTAAQLESIAAVLRQQSGLTVQLALESE